MAGVLRGGGEMGALVRSLDWAATPAGPPERWPQSLRTAVGICMAARLPTLVWWGPELLMFHNDAARALLGPAAPAAALGRPARAAAPALWPSLAPLLRRVLEAGEAVCPDGPLLARDEAPGARAFAGHFSPIPGEDGGVGGVLGTLSEAEPPALRQSEARLAMALGAAQMVAWEWDVGTDRITASDTMAQIYGLPALRAAEDGMRLVHPEDRAAHQATVLGAIERGGRYHLEYRITRPDTGQVVWLEEWGYARRDGPGAAPALVGVTRDVTARKATEAALRASEAQLRLITDGMPALVSYVDSERRYRFVNREYTQWFGHPAEAVRGRYVWEVLGEAAYQAARPEIDRVLAGEHVTFERTVPYRHGGSRYVRASYIPDRRETGQVRGYFALIVDLSERKRFEDALRQSEEQYRLLTDLSLHMVWTLGPGGEITYLSRTWFEYTGLSWDEVRRSGWQRALHPDERGAVLATLRAHLARAEPYAIELRLRSRSGDYRWHLTRAAPLTDEAEAVVRWLGVTFDIDERKRAEEALRASEERYRSLTHMLTTVVWRTDDQGAFIAPQPEWEAFTGQTWEQSRGWGWAEAVHPDDRPQLEARWRQSLAAGGRYEVRGRLWHAATATYHHCVAQAVPLRRPDGGIREWIGMLTDTHEQELRERDARFMADLTERIRLESDPDALLSRAAQAIAEHLPVRRCLIVDIDAPADHAVVRAEHCRGVAPVPREYRVSAYSPLARAEMETGRTIVNRDSRIDPRTAALYEQTYGPAGERAYLAVPLMRDGQWNGTLWVSDDVPRAWEPRELALLEAIAERVWLAAERLRAERALRAYAGQLLRLNAASLGINAATSLDAVLQQIADRSREVVGAGQAAISLARDEQWAQALTAVSRPEGLAAGRGYAVPPDDAGIIALVCRSNQPVRLSRAQLEAHPAWRGLGAEAAGRPPRSWLAAPLTAPDGGNIGLIQLADKAGGDFTAADEAVLVQLAQIASVAIENARLYAAAQDAVHVRDQFLSIAAHELKTPLTALLGYSQILLRRVAREGALGERDQRVLRQSAEQALRLNRLIDTLLDVSRIESGRLSIEREPLDLGALLRRTAEALRTTLERHTVELSGADDPLVIPGDELRLEQVFQNLLGNAVKYSPAGGAVRVALSQRGGQAHVAVSDEGVGIPQEALGQLFQRFYRVADVTTRHIAGMGIGLYVVKEIVALHGGTVAVESSEGAGSTFTVSLPLSEGAHADPDHRG